MAVPARKTRTTSAHGPALAKKPYKAPPTPAALPAPGSVFKKPFINKSKPDSSAKSKKRKADNDGDDGNDKSRSSSARVAPEGSTTTTTTTSLLNAPDEIDFVRGGGTGLTQIEVREAQLEGQREAADEEEDERERETGVVPKSKAKRRKLEREKAVSAIKEKHALPKDAFRVEHLSYKRLVPGTKVLAQIIAIRPLELIVSLPNQLLAHVPITNISSEYTALLQQEEDDSDDADSDDDSDASAADGIRLPPLSALFKEGDWVSTIVVDSGAGDVKGKRVERDSDEVVRASRKVTLSVEPEKVNEGIATGDLKAGFVSPNSLLHPEPHNLTTSRSSQTLTASVKSVEDHGYVLSLGLPTLTSFLAFKEAVTLQSSRLHVGQIVACRIKDVSKNGRTCNVSVARAEVTGSFLSTAASITSILPSTLVTAVVTAVLTTGLNVKFLGFFDGSIDLFHLGGRDPEKDFKAGQKIKARVLYDAIRSGTGEKTFSLSLAPHVLQLSDASVDGVSVNTRFPVGRTLDGVKVVGLDDEWGLTVEIEEEQSVVPGFVHISRITDDHLPSIPKSGPWKVGTTHRARVVGFSAVDGLVQLSFQPSVLAQAFLRVSDVQVGSVVKGTVKRLSDKALFVEISGNVDGVVWPLHYADIKLKHPEKKFKAGSSVKARVFAVDIEKNRVVLTLKKQLVSSELSIVSSLADAKVGMVTHATVTKVLDKSILVDLFGGLRALVPAAEAAETFTNTDELSRLFNLGQVVAVRIMSVDIATGRLVASIRKALEGPASGPEAPEIGSITSGQVSAIHESNIVLALQPDGFKALISFATLARHRKMSVDALRDEIAVGHELEGLVVVSRNAEKGFVIVGLVPSTSSSSKPSEGAKDLTHDSLKEGQIVSGRVSGKVASGVLVQVSRSVRARVPFTEVADDFSLVDSPALAVGTTVRGRVLAVDASNRRVDLSLRPSRLQDASANVKTTDPVIDSVESLTPGQTVRGFVKNVANQGLFVSLGTHVTARVLIKELFDEYVKEWKTRFTVGDLVEGKILNVDPSRDQVEMSLRKNAAVKVTEVQLEDLEKGQVIRGVIKKVESYGVFIRLDGSTVSGLCHKSKITDEKDISWTELVREGQEVRAVITEVNKDTKKISLGLKRSLFPEGALDSDDESSSGAQNDSETEEEELQEDEDDVSYDDETLEDNRTSFSAEDEEIDIVMTPVASTSKLQPSSGNDTKPLPVPSFKWSGGDDESDAGHDTVEEEDDSEGESEVEPEAPSVPRVSRRDLSTLEDRTGDLDTQTPTTVGDFERLLLGSPNSSYIWIQYIAFYVGLSQLDKAREIARRALRTINFREETEKLNVWVAMLNLENSYGTETSLEELFKEAAQSNDAKTVHLRLIDIYERSQKYEAEEELFKRLVKKFGQSSKAWTLFGQFYLTRGRPEDARELLPRSLKSLEKRKHIKTISKFAQLEFKLGTAERGRTIFEGIMDTVPKRLDLWFIYVDMEIKQRNIAGVRALFDRILAQRLSSKKGKSVFKKWLTFEKEFGDDAGVETCKRRALEFVESL